MDPKTQETSEESVPHYFDLGRRAQEAPFTTMVRPKEKQTEQMNKVIGDCSSDCRLSCIQVPCKKP